MDSILHSAFRAQDFSDTHNKDPGSHKHKILIKYISESKVMLVHNEHIVEEQPACGETLCSVEEFKARYQHIVDFDWDKDCRVDHGQN